MLIFINIIADTVISTSSLQFWARLEKNPPSASQPQPPDLILPTAARPRLSPVYQPHTQAAPSQNRCGHRAGSESWGSPLVMRCGEVGGVPREPTGVVVDICGTWDRGSLPTQSEVFQYFSDRYNFTGADPNTPAWAGLHSLVSIPPGKGTG